MHPSWMHFEEKNLSSSKDGVVKDSPGVVAGTI
jgi:hypothetical protein